LNVKIGLLQIYSQDLESSEDHDHQEDDDRDSGGGGRRSLKRNSSVLIDLDVLQQKVSSLEKDNRQLRDEASSRLTDLDQEEKREMQLIADCVKQLCESLHLFFRLLLNQFCRSHIPLLFS
jgi:hypothetical protein